MLPSESSIFRAPSYCLPSLLLRSSAVGLCASRRGAPTKDRSEKTRRSDAPQWETPPLMKLLNCWTSAARSSGGNSLIRSLGI